MTSFLRRLSSSLPSSSDPDSGQPSTSIFRRKSSSASVENPNNTTFRSLGARDYKLGMSPSEEEAVRRSSIAEMVVGEDEEEKERDREEGSESGELVRKRTGSAGTGGGRIYGARDWRLIGKA